MLRFDPQQMRPREIYALMIGAIVPRPIAFVSTINAAGQANCAPFSYFMGVSSEPPIVAISVGVRRDGRPKDTAANIRETGVFVINVVDALLAEPCVRASAEVEPEVDEFDLAALAKEPSELIAAPRIASAPIQMECRLERCLEIGVRPQFLILGEVLRFHVAERVWKDGAIDIAALDPIARLGGDQYAPVRDVFRIPRPAR